MADLNDDIARYLSGRMSATEMHALEKRALSDPFVADALAGGESIAPDEFSADVAALQEQIAQRSAKRATVAPLEVMGKATGRQVTLWSWPMRIAAGLLLVASASAIYYFIRDEKQLDNLALNKEPGDLQKQESKSNDSVRQSSTMADSVGALEGVISGIQKNEAAPSEPKSNAPDHGPAGRPDLSRQAISAPPAATPQLQAPQPVVAESDEVVSDAEAPPAERAERRELAFAQSENDDSKAKKADIKKEKEDVQPEKEAAQLDAGRSIASNSAEAELKVPSLKKLVVDPKNVFMGKVVDDDGNGIPGVNVIVKGTNTGTVTDVNGNYQLALDEAKPTLVYTFIGYTNTEEVAEVAKPMTVQLDEDATQLSEVVVAGYGAQRELDPVESTYDFAYPIGGKRQFKQYLEKNLQYPQAALLNNVEGRVTVQFAVETTGSLADFKVLKGIGSGCDEEVIRLIKSGPKWNPTKRDEVVEKSVIKVRMRFQLPKKKK